MSRYLPFVVFIAIALGGGTLLGLSNSPGAWYEDLAKPAFNPPGWIFGPVWTVLYILVGIAGALVWKRDPGSKAVKLWFAQMAVNFAWSPVFFTAHAIGAALAVISVMFVLIVAFIATTWRDERGAALLFLPYAAWVGFATVLNATLWTMN